MRRIVPLFSALAIVFFPAAAQRSRYTSPPAKTSVTFGEVWCTGANIATGFTTEADLRIGDLKLPKGAYSIWTVPGEKEWTLIVNKETGQFHLNYNSSLDFGRTPMKIKTLEKPVETFRVDLRSDGGNKGTLALLWENTEASIGFTVVP